MLNIIGIMNVMSAGLVKFSKIFFCRNTSFRLIIRWKHVIDRSLVPELKEDELEEQYIKGSGPGGSNVNKRINCVRLTHIPTGLTVKAHQSRELGKNRQIARAMLVTKLDNLINGEKSVENQKKSILERKGERNKSKQAKIREIKQKWKEELETEKKSKEE